MSKRAPALNGSSTTEDERDTHRTKMTSPAYLPTKLVTAPKNDIKYIIILFNKQTAFLAAMRKRTDAL